MTKVAGLLGDLAGALLRVLLVPAALIVLGLPIVLFARLVIEIASRHATVPHALISGRAPAVVYFLLGNQLFNRTRLTCMPNQGERFTLLLRDTELKADGAVTVSVDESHADGDVDMLFLTHDPAYTVRNKLSSLRGFRVRNVHTVVIPGPVTVSMGPSLAQAVRRIVRRVRQLVHDDRDVSGLLFACAAMNFFALVAGTELRRSVLCKQLVLLDLQRGTGGDQYVVACSE